MMMAGPPLPMSLEELEMCTAADSLAAAPGSEGDSTHTVVMAHATAVAHVAAVAHDAAKELEAASAAVDSCDPFSTRFSIHELHCLRIVLFVPAHTPTRGHNLADEPRD